MSLTKRRQTMNNYNITKESSLSGSSYLLHEEKQQRQWINQVAKKAAKLISEQIRESDKETKDSK